MIPAFTEKEMIHWNQHKLLNHVINLQNYCTELSTALKRKLNEGFEVEEEEIEEELTAADAASGFIKLYEITFMDFDGNNTYMKVLGRNTASALEKATELYAQTLPIVEQRLARTGIHLRRLSVEDVETTDDVR